MKIPLCFGSSALTTQGQAATNYVVITNGGVIYQIYFNALTDIVWKKSSDGGLNWTAPVTIFAGTATQLAVWYGRWSDRADDNIYMAYGDSGLDDISFRILDTTNDTLNTEVLVFAGASTAAGGSLSITIAKGGNIIIAGWIDAGAEGGTFKSTDGGATWGATIANAMEATNDHIFLAPGFNADTQDVMGIYMDSSTNELSVKRYDDSANTWNETVISTGIADTTAATMFPNFALTPDIANSQLVVIGWNAVDAASQDLLCWTVTDTTITAKTDVVSNATDDCMCAALVRGPDGTLYAFWAGNPDGSETVFTAVNIYYKSSTDGGTTWSSMVKITPQVYAIKMFYACPRNPLPFDKYPSITWDSVENSNEFQHFTIVTAYAGAPTGQTIIA